MGLTTEITVTVIAESGIDADSLATAVSVLGAERGFEFIERRPGTAVRIVTPSNSRESRGFTQ
jgi:thiamine biosynthesis lipoprotein